MVEGMGAKNINVHKKKQNPIISTANGILGTIKFFMENRMK
jgi:hypothetical protein